MASARASRATQNLVFSCSGWLKGLLPGCALPTPVQQRQVVLPCFGKQCRNFSSLQCVTTTSKPGGALKFRLTINQTDRSARSVFETGKLGSRLNGSNVLLEDVGEHRRGFSSTASAANQFGVRKGERSQEQGLQQGLPVEHDWALRLANENGFLSWCRNSYLTTVVGIAMMAEGMTPLTLQAAEGALFVAALNLTWGTYQYIYNLLRLRRRTGMSALGSLTYMSMALLHLGLWFVVCSLFLGYSDDTDSKPPAKGDKRRDAHQGDDG